MRRPGRLRAAAGAAALAALLLSAGPASATTVPAPAVPVPAAAAPAAGAPAASPAPVADAVPSGVDLVLEALSPAAVQPGDHVLVRVRVVNGTTAPLDAARVRLFVNSPALTTRAAVQAWADGTGVQGGDRFAGVDGAEQPLVAPVPPGGSAEVSIDVSADQLRLGPTWGPRGVTVDVLDAGLQRLADVRTFLVWTPSGAPAQSTGLTVLAPLSAGAPDVTEGRLPAERVEQLTAPGGRLTRVLAATSDPAVALALDPAVLGSGGSGGSAPGAAPWLAQLSVRAADQEVLGLPEGDPDAEALASADQGALYRLAETEGRSRVQASLGAPARSDVAWPAGGTADGQVLDLTQANGRTAVVLDARAVPGAAEAGSAGTPPARVTLSGRDGGRGPTAGLLVDAGMSASFVQGSSVTGADGHAAALARLLADTAVAAASPTAGGPGASVLLAAPRDWDPDPVAATAELTALRAAPWVRARPLADLLSTAPAATLRLPERSTDPAALPADGLAQAAAAVSRARVAAGVFEDPESTTALFEERAVAAASASWRADQPAWRAELAELGASADRLANGVQVVQGSAVTVISSQVNLPVTLRNDLAEDATVVVTLRSNSLRVRPQGSSKPVTIAKGAQQQLVLPVRALASGDTTLSVLLSTPDGHRIGAPATLSVRVRADWEGRGVFVAAALVALVLVLGLLRTARRVRRRPPPAPPTGRPPTGGPPAGGATATGAAQHRPVRGVAERARG